MLLDHSLHLHEGQQLLHTKNQNGKPGTARNEKMKGDKSNGSMTREALRTHLCSSGFAIRQQVLQGLSKGRFWWQGQRQGRAEAQLLSCTDTAVWLSDPELLPGQQQWLRHCSSSPGQHKPKVTAQSICSPTRNC